MITEHEIVTALNAMSEIDVELEKINMEKERMIDSVLTPEIRQQLQDIEAEFSDKQVSAKDRRNAMEILVRNGVVGLGQSVVANRLQAVFTKGRYSWDKKVFDKLVKKYPEIEEIRTQGDPFVSIKKVAQEETTE